MLWSRKTPEPPKPFYEVEYKVQIHVAAEGKADAVRKAAGLLDYLEQGETGQRRRVGQECTLCNLIEETQHD